MSTTQVNPQTSFAAAAAAPAVKAIECGRYGGAFAQFQRSFFHTLVAFGIGRPVAHKVGEDFGSDLGRAMSKDTTVAAAVGKANKNGEAAIKLSGKSARVACSNAMSLNRLCQLMEAAFNEKLVTKRMLPECLNEELGEYLKDCAKWAEGKRFE